jgi:hypothetical protein
MTDHDQILRSIALLSGIRDNVPKGTYVTDRWVAEYHSALEKAAGALSLDLNDFRVPANDLKQIVVGGNYLTKEVRMSKDERCDAALFKQKIDSLLSYLNMRLSPPPEEPKKMGFQ